MTDSARDRQIALEEEAVFLGVARYDKEREGKDESSLGPGRALMRRTIGPMVEAITTFIAEANSGRAGRRLSSVKWIESLDPVELAYLTATCVINALPEGDVKMQTLGNTIATAIEDSIRYERFREESPALYHTLQQKLQRSTSSRHNRKAMSGVLASHPEITPFRIPTNERTTLGLTLLELFIQSTGLAETFTDTSHGPRRWRVLVRGNENLMRWLDEAHARNAAFMPVRMPMIVPPKEWHGPRGGGYLTSAGGELSFVRTRNRGYLRELEDADMPIVYESVNRVQSTPWAINRAILGVMQEAWESGGGIAGLPERDLLPLPPPPPGLLADGDAWKAAHAKEFKAWKRERAAVYEENARSISKRVAASQKIALAAKFANEEAIYFPHTLDFRGRMYPVPSLLTPQGDDVSKGLLQFAKGKPLGAEGAMWLAVHIANLFGVDKVSFAERIQWVRENEDMLLDSALDPLDGNRFWTRADSPWQALAACMEWAGYVMTGDEYVSHLPIALDGSCNGLQNFSAMLRDEVGGMATNLCPLPEPADIYTEVLEIVKREVGRLALEGVPEAIVLDGAKALNRDVVKRPVMTLPYGVTRAGMRSQILAEFKRQGYPDDWNVAEFLAGLLWNAIGEVVVAARHAMDWLRDTAKLASSADVPIRWTTPAGFPVLQEYREDVGHRLNTHIAGRRVQLTLSVEGTKLNRRRQAMGISPNFVHSCDAAHMMRTVVLAADNGVQDFAMIHDSYGTHAADTGILASALRHAFVEQYEEDVLGQFRDELAHQLPPEVAAELPPLPSRGTLDLSAVIDSAYFFA